MGYYKTKALSAIKADGASRGSASGGSSSQKTLTAKATNSLGGNVFVRSAATIGDIVGDVLVGAAKSLEGVGDFALTGVGAVGGIFDGNIREAVRRIVERDYVGTYMETPLESLTKDSYFNDLKIGKHDIGEAAELVAQGVGGMLPSIAVALLTGGTSIPAQIASMGTMAAGAAGNATEEAFGEGASYGSGMAYGALRGVTEAATEKLGGVVLGGGTSAVGKAIAGTSLGKAAQKGVGRAAYTFISEGAEEVLSDLADPLTKYITGVDKNVGENYNEVMSGLGKTFMVGGTVGAVMGSAQDTVISRTKTQLARGGMRAVRSDRYLQDAAEVSENLRGGEGSEKYLASIMQSYKNISDELVQMSESERARYLDSIGVHRLAFGEDGTLKAATAENVNPEAVSPTLRAISANLSHSPISAETETSESARLARDTVEKAIGKGANVVISEDIGNNNALYNPDEDVIYISNGVFDGSDFGTEDISRAIALHEVAHKAEGTAAYTAMLDEVEKILEDDSAPAEVKALLGNVEERRAVVNELYEDENLNEVQNKYVAGTELVANMVGDLLGNPYFVERMGARNDGAWKRFVTALKVAHDGKAGGISKSSQKYLSGLYKAYVRAVDDAGQGLKISSMVDEEEKEKAVENGARASRQRKYPEGNYENGDVYTRGRSERAYDGNGSARAGTENRKEQGIRYIQGDRQGRGRESSSLSDSEGRIIHSEILEQIAETSVVDGDGRPLALYHYTPDMNFKRISESSDIGFHSGTLEQAIGRSKKNDGRIFRNYYNIKKPLSVRADIGAWKPSVLAMRLYAESCISKSEYEEVMTLAAGDRIQNYSSLSAVKLREILKAYGYDGISYPNGVEADGMAYIAFDKGQIVTTEILKYENGKVLAADNVGVKNSDERQSKKANVQKVIDLSNDDKLSALVKDVHGSKRYNIIREYILAELADQPIRLSDGKMAVVDKRDAQHIAQKSGTKKTAAISHIKEIVEAAELVAEEASTKENKFSHFWYYEAHALYEGEPISLYVNVGQARNASSYHIYDITKKIRDTAHRVYDVGRPVGHALLNGISGTSIPQNSEKSTENAKKDSDERYSKKKVYPKEDASVIIDEVVLEHLIFDDVYGEMKGKTKQEATGILWKALNTAEPGERGGAALRVADYVIDNAVAKTFGEDPNVEIHAKTLSVLKPYLRKLDLDGIKGEIVNRFGKKNSIHLVWGKREGDVGVAPDAIKAELNEQGVIVEANNPADIFFEIYDLYKEAKEGLERSARALLKNGLTSEEREVLRQDIAKDILKAYDEKGSETLDLGEFHRELERAQRRAEFWKAKYFDERDKNHITNRLLDKARHLDDLKKGAFLSATQSRTWIEKFKGSIFRLSQIRFRGNLNRRGTRRICAALHAWYTDENNELIRSTPGLYDENIANALKNLANNERVHTEAEEATLDKLRERFKTSDLKKIYEGYTVENMGKGYDGNVKQLLHELSSESIFSKDELLALETVVDYFAHFVKNHNKVWRAGKYVDAPDLARGYIDRFVERQRKSPGTLRKWFESYYSSYGDPMALARYMDSYDPNGFFTGSLEEIRRAGMEAAILEMEIREQIEKFYKEHKKFLGELQNKRVKDWNGAEIPLANAISLYMTLGREQAIKGLARKGYVFKHSEKSEDVRLGGFMPVEEVTDDQLQFAAKEARDNLYGQFTEDEKTYIGLVEKALEACKKAKYDTDMIRHGYSNTIDGYYFPIARAYVSHSIDATSIKDELDCVSSKPFNEDTVTGAEGELFINAVDAILNRHVRGVSQYAKLSTVIDNFNILYSLNVNEDTAQKPKSIATESKSVWFENEAYFKKLISDVQGIRLGRSDTLVAKLLPTIRSGYAKYLLGANPKVWITQLSSLAASTSILDANSIIKGFSMRTGKDEVDKYCALAKLRNTDNTAALAQGVLDKVSGFGDVLMKPIGAVDRFVINRLFAACQVQVAKNGAAELGTKENKVKAGELLERVILETQQNSLATERSAAMRSENEIEKTLTMFSADAMKVFGRVVDAWGETTTLKRMIKLARDENKTSEAERYQNELKRAEKQLCRSVGALLSSAVMMALIAQLIRRLLNKKDKDDVASNIAGDVASNLIGGLPIIRDIADSLMSGYDIDYYAFSAANDLLSSASDILSLSRDAMEGEWDEQKTAKAIRNAFYSAGMMLGVPTRNMYNYAYAAINMVSPEAGYRMDDLFYSKSYRSDLTAAIESGDEGMVATITALMLDSSIGGLTDKALRSTMRDLLVADFDVLPQSVKDSVTYGGQAYELNVKQKKAFEKIYFGAHGVAADLVKRKEFASASDEVKAKAISFVYDLYYDMAVYDRVGGAESKNTLFAKAIDVGVLALAISTAKTFESDKDANGNAIPGSLKNKIHNYVETLPLKAVQKRMIMGYLGYKNSEDEASVRAYIQSLKMTAEQKRALFEASGY